VNPGISVSRVGGAAQVKAMKKVAGMLRLNLAQFRELEAFAQFGSDLDKTTQAQLHRGARLVEILKQPQYQPLPVEKQILIILAATRGYCDKISLHALGRYEIELYEYFDTQQKDLIGELAKTGNLTDELDAKVEAAIKSFTDTIWKEGKHE
jgi:F-type H+-transporting ATPase subunit alpha